MIFLAYCLKRTSRPWGREGKPRQCPVNFLSQDTWLRIQGDRGDQNRDRVLERKENSGVLQTALLSIQQTPDQYRHVGKLYEARKRTTRKD